MLKKYLNGNVLKFNIDFNPQLPKALSSIPNISLSSTSLTPPSIPNPADKFKFLNTNVNAKHYLGQLGSQLIDYGSQVLSNGLFGDDSEVGRAVGGAMSGTLGSVGNTLLDNFIKGNTLYEGLGKNAISGASGALGGLAASQVGKGITSIMGDSNLGRFTGGAASSALGQILGGGVGNPINFASNALGAGLSAMTGPSKEYGGKYGNVTQTMDSIYGAALGVVGMMGPVGAAISAGMALNKGLSNIFGSTSGMTKQDAILGSAFMPAPVKWLNMAGAETTDTLKNLSWQNSEKTNTFMLNAFGNLQAKLDDARDKAGKTYGTFSRGSYRDAQNAIDFANDAYGTLLAMADLNELQKIRSLYMTSINNLRYAQNIQGGWSPLAIGKQGMKIFNNATNHNMGMRLLSAAALIDNKQMILSFLGGGTPRYLKHKKPTGGAKKFRALTQEELDNRTPEITVTPVTQRTPEELNEEWERTHPNGGNADPNLSRVSDLTSGIFNLTTKPPFTGQEYQQAIEAQRLKKLDRFHEAEEIGEAALMADLAVSAAPLLLRGFRWAFNKAGNLVRVPIQRTNLFLTSPYTGKWTLFGSREYRFKPGYAAMNGAPIESRPIKTIRLYRATGTNGKFDASLDGGQEFAGQWFTNDPTKPLHYASMTVKRARRAGVENPIELLYVDIPESELNKYRASEILKGRTDIEYEPTEDFLIPLDYPRQRVPLEGYTGNLLLDARRPLPELPIESRTLKITPKNATSITPEQWTAAQDAAIARGDMAEAQRLRDLHFRTYQTGDMVDVNGNPIHVYHGSPEENIIEFYKPNDPRLPTPKGTNYKATGEEGIYTSPRKGYAANYMADLGGRYRIPLTKEQKALLKAGKTREEIGLPSIPQGRIYDLYSNTKLVPEDLNIDFDPFTLSTKEAELIKSRGYSGFDIPGKKYPEHVVLEPNQLKLADAITYDNNGVRIPLGMRDNFKLNDIRYSWLPWFLGGSTAATLHNTNK